MVATDRISAFDVVLPTGIPEKGIVLTEISAFWFNKTKHIIDNHMVALSEDLAPTSSQFQNIPEEVSKRGMVVNRANRLDVECIVRGYLAGSAWGEYKSKGTIFLQAQKPKLMHTANTKQSLSFNLKQRVSMSIQKMHKYIVLVINDPV